MSIQCGNCKHFTPFLDSPNGTCAKSSIIQPALDSGGWWCGSYVDKETGKGPPERWKVKKPKKGRKRGRRKRKE